MILAVSVCIHTAMHTQCKTEHYFSPVLTTLNCHTTGFLIASYITNQIPGAVYETHRCIPLGEQDA